MVDLLDRRAIRMTPSSTSSRRALQLVVNGETRSATVEPRLLLSDFLRQELALTGTHVGCEHGVCGACTVLVDGEAVRSCLLFAIQADGRRVVTVEGLADGDRLHPLQQAFREAHALQCGFCTPGFLLTLIPFLAENPDPDDRAIRAAISGNLCRCTGYQHIVEAVRIAARAMRAAPARPQEGPVEGPVEGPEEGTVEGGGGEEAPRAGATSPPNGERT